MKSQGNSLVLKSINFAVSAIKLCKALNSNHEYIISKQLIRSGTSVGANIQEANGAESRKDFVHKLSIAFKESRETKYWLYLLLKTDYIEERDYRALSKQLTEVQKLLSSSIATAKKKN